MAQTLTRMPALFSAGTTVKYTRTLDDYRASQGWGLSLVMAGKSVLTVAGVTNVDSFDITVTAANSAAMLAGVYRWLERASKAGEVYDVDGGYVTVAPNVATATAGSLQLHIEKALDLLEARIEERVAAGHDMESYHADSHGVVKVTLESLINERNSLQQQLRGIAAGGQFSRKVLVTFPGIGFSS